MILQEMDIGDANKEHVQRILTDFKTTPPTFDNVQNDLTIENLNIKFSECITKLRELGKTAQLWLQYYELVTIAMHFIESERTGNWKLHLDCIKAMLPIFHASGHFLYAKSCQLYLHDMSSLQEKMPAQEFEKFTKEGFFTIRRTEKHWCGVWSDMAIEQTLMKSIKSVGGITHGRGFTDSVLNKWILGLPAAYHVCANMEKFCALRTESSHQHVELRDLRMKKDQEDCDKLLQWLQRHSPFINNSNLLSLSSGLVATEDINCYRAKEIGEKSLHESVTVGSSFKTFQVKRSNRAKPISSMNNTVKVKGGEVQIDSTLLFQRIICTIHSTEDLKTCFTYELASMPLSIFDEKERPIDFVDSDFVIDGGHLIHHVVWPKQGTFATVYTAYVEYVKKHYGQRVTVVFDGYSQNSNSTKSIERQQRLMQRISPEIIFDENTALTEPQQKFLSNLVNKERFISQLITKLESEGIGVTVAADDADLLIVQTAVEKSYQCESAVIVGQDVDLVTLLIALSPSDKDIKFVKEERGKTSKRIYSSRDLQSSTLLKNCKEAILFAHAISGCDTTSAFFCKGKIQTIALLNKRQDLQDVVPIFNNQESSHEDIASAGEQYILALYKAPPGEESLDNYRFLAVNKLVGKAHNNVLLPKLQPTSAAARQHCYRVFHQIQAWKDNSLNPTEWGWKKLGNSLTPIPTTNALAPATILTLISCGCKLGCGNRCGCVKAGLRCSTMCTNCHGQACLNVDSIGSTEDDDDDDVDADDIP